MNCRARGDRAQLAAMRWITGAREQYGAIYFTTTNGEADGKRASISFPRI